MLGRSEFALRELPRRGNSLVIPTNKESPPGAMRRVATSTSLPRVLFFSGSIFTPMNSRPETTLARVSGPFSPTPAVKMMASTPPMAAA